MTEIVERMFATDTKYKAVDYIETYTGRQFRPHAPDINALSVIDMAHSLSNQARYSGHTAHHYSVAQHSCLLAQYTEQVLKRPAVECLQILMHDTPEAYLVDVPRPVKQFLPEFRKWDHGIYATIAEWLGTSSLPIPAYQDEIDSRICMDERIQLMSDSGNDWGFKGAPLDVVISRWSPEHAEQQFLYRYAVYSKEVFGEHRYLKDVWGIPTRSHYQSSSDVSQNGLTSDLIEVDFLGGVGKIKLRSEDGMMVRDREGGAYPRPAWKWLHGKFTLEGTEHGARAG